MRSVRGPSRLLLMVFALIACGCAVRRPTGVGSLGLPVPTTNLTPPQHPLDADDLGLPNFGTVTHDVFRGGQPTQAGLDVLARLGVKTVIDLRADDAPQTMPAGMRLVRLPVSAWRADTVDPRSILQAISKNSKPVFIHCLEGRDRTGLAVAIYRLSIGMSADDACRELRNFHVNPWWQALIERRIHQLQASSIPK